MLGRNHVALALAAPLAGQMFNLSPLPAAWPAWAGLALGALAPDIDGEGSICYLGNFLPRGITPGLVVRLLNWVGRTISSGIRAVFGHRAAFHWPVLSAALIFVGWRLGLAWLLWFGVGYGLHIAGDMLTKSGVPLLGPLTGRDFSLLPIRTGGCMENIMGGLLWAFVAWRLAVLVAPLVGVDFIWQLI